MTGFWRQTCLLMRKNYILKKRSLRASICEILMPILLVLLLIVVYSVIDEDQIDTNQHLLERSGDDESRLNQYNNYVPPFAFSPYRLDAMNAKVALVKGTNEVSESDLEDFQSVMDEWYPGITLNMSSILPGTAIPAEVPPILHVPKFSDVSEIYESQRELERSIESDNYASSPGDTIVFAAIAFNKVDNDWDYSIRMNVSATPWTIENVDVLQRDVEEERQRDYLRATSPFEDVDEARLDQRARIPGFLTLQLMVDRYIIRRQLPEAELDDDFFLTQFENELGETAFGSSGITENLDFHYDSESTAKIRNFLKAETYLPQRVRMAPFPIVGFESNLFFQIVGNVFPLFLLISFLAPTSYLIRGIVQEKENRIREGMQMMGLSTSSLYTSWFLTYLVIFTIISLAMALLTLGTFFSNSGFGALFFLFLMFGVSTTAFCFMISVFFSRAKTASTVGVLLYFAAFFPFWSIDGPEHSAGEKTMASLLAPTAFAQSVVVLSEFEDRGQGIVIGDNDTLEFHNFSYSIGVGMMVVDTIIYLVIAWYFDAVWPKEFGVRQPPYFFLLPKYWKGIFGCTKSLSSTHPETVDMPTSNDIAKDNPNVETVSGDQLAKERGNKAIRIKDLRKVFDSGSEEKVAVNNLSLNVHEGEIFVLLGHNGAGKTTTISMLTGLLAPTSGRMQIYNEDVSEDLSAIRQYLGVCPQHDVLWDDLTVKEHLELYAGLKGVPRSKVDDAVAEIIKDVGLTEKVDTQSQQLSGGQKRKLSVAIALLGDSKVVVLDEPTSGMDPYSRRSTWDIIRNARKNRIVMLTTHFMDEADLLGDRISILAHGKLQCCGSSMFLKRRYGVGYLLTMVKDPSKNTSGGSLSMIKEHIPDAEIHSEVGTELSVRLPMNASSQFPTILSQLDDRLGEFGLTTYGLSATTLEEVFLQVARDEDPTNKNDTRTQDNLLLDKNGKKKTNDLLSNASDGASKDQPEVESRGISIEEVRAHARTISEDSFRRHFVALFLKRFHYYKRDAKAACFQLVIPILAVLFGLLLIRAGIPGNFPSYEMSSAKLNIQPSGRVLENPVPHTTFLTDESGTGGLTTFSRFNDYLENVPSRNASFLPYEIMDASGQTDFFDFYQRMDIPDDLQVYSALLNFTTHLLQSRTNLEASKYGALSPVTDLIDSSTHLSQNDSLEYLVQQNSTAFHACPIFMNLMNSAIYGEHQIITRNHPLPWTGRQQTIISGIGSFFAALIIVLAFAFIPASYAIFIVKEREIAAKHQQLISGVSIAAYWVSTFVWDFLSYLLPMFGSILIIYLFDVEELVSTDDDRLAALFLLFLFYGSSVSGQTYMFTYFFKSHSAAQNFVLFLNMISMILVLASFIMRLVEATCEVNDDLQYLFMFFPGYALGTGLIDLSFLSIIRQLNECDGDQSVDNGSTGGGEDPEPDENGADLPPPAKALDSAATQTNILYMAILTVVYFLIALGIDYFLARPDLVAKFSRKPAPANEKPLNDSDIDADVRKEAERCDAQGAKYSPSDDVILLQHLRKVYAGGKLAVRDISFGVPAGEVFGFLGINGAGKTSTLKMLTGDILPTEGHARLAGYDIVSEQSHLRTLLGYCPQFEALLELLTVREHLELFSRIKGIPSDRIGDVVKEKMQQLSLEEFENKRAGSLSGGNKRKLSVAIALIGNPPLLFLDEPSTGMDPVTRRVMWDVIADISTRRREASIILTTHSMEECEALATRVGIMVGGRLRCLGTIQHIKNTHAQGYQLRLKLGPAGENALASARETIISHLPTLKAQATNSECRIPESQLKGVCSWLGDAEMYDEISPEGTGWMIYASVAASEDRSAENFRGSELIEQQGTLLNFSLPPQDMSLSKMFAKLEEAKDSMSIQEYALSQTSLEQVFNYFAAQQEEEKNVAHGMRRARQHSGGGASLDDAE